MNDDELRRTIRDAMTRLVGGHPIRSDGKLTVKSLAEEAGIKRWVLTHKHTDLQDEFRAMADGVGGEPDVVLRLREQIAEQDGVIARQRVEIHELTTDRNQLERIVNILSIENRMQHQERVGVTSLDAARKSTRKS